MVELARTIVKALNETYGRPERLVLSDPIDELISTILSQHTTDKNSHKAFGTLKDNFKSWYKLLKTDTRKVARLIKSSGLANIKARRIKDILHEIMRRERKIGLSSLKDLKVEDASAYLTSLRGVGPKTASCVLLFSFGRPAMPVDTHIYRVCKRLGLLSEGISIEEAHKILSRLVPKGLIYEFHLGIIRHGRLTCRAQNPKCGECALYNICPYPLAHRLTRNGT